MAKNKKSKILASMLAVSTMAVFYAAPVMAAKVDVTSGNLTGVTTQNNRDYSFTGGTLNLDDANIAGALNGQNVNLGTGAITANGITSTAGITAANGQFQVYGGSGGIAATSLSLLNNGSQNVLITNSGMARFGDSNSENVRIEDGVLRVFDGKTELASLTSNGLTLNDGTVQGSLTATQLATINSAITTQNNKTVITGDELNIKGASGGLYVRDVVDGKTMIYTKAADADGTNTVWIDPENGNISTIGTVGVTDDLESGKLITQIQGSGENIGDIAVGIQYDGEGNITGQNIVLDASTGDVISKGDVTTLNDDGSEKYSLNTIGEQVDGIGADLGDNGRLGGITREDKIGNDGKLDTTTIEGTTSFDANGMRVTNENDGRAVAITKDRGIEVFGGNGASNAVITNNGTARFGAEAGANVRIENGDVTSTYYDEDGKVGHYSLNNIGDKTQNMWADGSQTNFSHSVNVEGSFSAGNGGAQLNGAWGKEASLKLRDAGNKTYTLTATQLGNINNVILENGVVNGAAGSNIGGVRFSGGGDLNDVNHINGAEVQGWGDGGLEISGVAMENGAIKVNAINGATVNYYGEGGLKFPALVCLMVM